MLPVPSQLSSISTSEHADQRSTLLLNSSYPSINGLSCSSLFYLQSTLPVHPSYFFITSFSLYSHLDFQSFLKARGCIYFLSPASNPNLSLLSTQHAHLKNCVSELSLGFFDKGWGVGSLMTHSFIFSTYKQASVRLLHYICSCTTHIKASSILI